MTSAPGRPARARSASAWPCARAVALVAFAAFALSPLHAAAQDAPAPAPQAPPRPTVLAIHVEGEKRYSEAQLIEALGQKLNQPLDLAAIQRGIQALWQSFRVRAEVREREVAGGVELELAVTEMPVDLEPRFVGNADIDKETLLKWAQLTDRGELYLYQAERVRQRLIEGYRQEGYPFAEIDVVKRGDDPASGELPDLIFEIREGPQLHVADVIVRGNVSMPDRGMWFWRDGLQKLAKTELEGPALFNWSGAKYDEEKLQADLLAMRNVYRDRGWLDAVVEVESLEYSDDRSKVTIHVVVDEGEPYTVSTLSIQAFKRAPDPNARGEPVDTPTELIYPQAELLKLCKLAPGQRYERTKQTLDMLELRKRYGHDGYLAHPSLGTTGWQFLDPELNYDLEKHQVAVTYRILQGEKRYVREVLFEGAEHTRDRVLRREVDVMPGAVADADEIVRSLNRIYSTGYFSNESRPLDHKDPTYRLEPVPGEPGRVDLVYEVEEGRVVELQLQGGIDSNNGAFGRVLLEMRNFDLTNLPTSLWRMPGEVYSKEAFHGAGQRLVLEVSPGTVVNSYQIRFVEPDLFRTQFDRYSLDMSVQRRLRRYRIYDEQRDDRRVRIGRDFGRNWSVFTGFTNAGLDITDIQVPLSGFQQPDGFPVTRTLFDEEGHSNLIGALFDVEYRKVDRTLNPTDGFTATWRNVSYGRPLGGDWDFVRTSVDMDWYWPIGPDSEDVRPGLHLSFGAGVADDVGGTSDVPYSERFFLGGNHILRGFDYRGVGPNDGGEPIGGETMLNASLEYRQPLYSIAQPGTYRRIEVFHFKLFTDAGLLDVQPWHVDTGELRASIGFGFGMSSPIPISLNFGFPIETGDGDRREVFSFSIVNITF